MELQLFRHLWGVDEPWDTFFPAVRRAGYHGVELPLPPPESAELFRGLLAEHGLKLIGQVVTRGPGGVDEHLRDFRSKLEWARRFPVHIVNSHSGIDMWPLEESRRFFREALAIERDLGLTVAHETHRGRVLFNPRDTRVLLEEFPALRVCADISHFFVVCERIPEDQADAFSLIAARTLHIHARVGYSEGPQVPDPRDPAYESFVTAHERFWDQVWDAQEARGDDLSTLTPEFGPPPYLHTQPFSGVPLGPLAEICDWQMRRQRDRFARREPRQLPPPRTP